MRYEDFCYKSPQTIYTYIEAEKKAGIGLGMAAAGEAQFSCDSRRPEKPSDQWRRQAWPAHIYPHSQIRLPCNVDVTVADSGRVSATWSRPTVSDRVGMTFCHAVKGIAFWYNSTLIRRNPHCERTGVSAPPNRRFFFSPHLVLRSPPRSRERTK